MEPKHGAYPHQNAPLEQFLELSQVYQAHAFCAPGCLFFCLCAVAPAQLGCHCYLLQCYSKARCLMCQACRPSWSRHADANVKHVAVIAHIKMYCTCQGLCQLCSHIAAGNAYGG